MAGRFLNMTPLILIPGMMLDARLFSPQIAAFEGERTVVVTSVAEQPTISGMAAAILRSAPSRFAVAGLSLGGIVAMEVFRQAPERIERLALMDTNPLAELEKVQKNRDRQIAWVGEEGRLAGIMQDEMKPNYLADGPKRADILDLCMDAAMALGPTVFVNQSRALQSRPDQSDTLRRVKVPTLILCGEQDALCPIERHQLMAALIPHANLVVIPGAGHLPTLEQPQATTDALRKWLED